jgi:YidC/Oxa1 family membrane protein insertase
LINLSKGQKVFALFAGLFVLSSCTASFCSEVDMSRIMYAYDGNNTVLTTGAFEANPGLQAVLDIAENDGIDVPSDNYWLALDQKILTAARLEASSKGSTDLDDSEILSQYGYVKFLGPDATTWGNFDGWNNQLKNDLPLSETPNRDFIAIYKNQVTSVASQYRSCITTTSSFYGPDGTYFFEGKTWADAFSRGLIEGLFVYPVAFLIESLNGLFASSIPGLSQVLSILATTIIVRGLMIVFTFKSTLATQKMTLLQPEIAKLQNKYPNSNTNQYERQKLAQDQFALYKKHGVNPFNQIIVAFVQFPVFIAVWGAMTGSAVLATGSFLGLNLSSPLGGVMTSEWFQDSWWTAVVIFLLMTAAQFVAMKLPMLLQKKSNAAVGSTVKSNAAQASQSQATMISNVMFVMIIVMGFSLPSAMGVYWFIGALISLAQTLITRRLMVVKK